MDVSHALLAFCFLFFMLALEHEQQANHDDAHPFSKTIF